jgi:hypothetical protein
MALINFKASAITIEERSNSFGPLPAGEYEMMIVKSETKPTKSGNGHYLELEMHVVSGQHSGRRHWERLNLDNPNQQAVKIAEESLAKLCMALKIDDVEDSEQLHDQVFIAEIGIDKKDETRNVIWGYQGVGGHINNAKPKAPAAPAPSAAPAKSAKPWG